MLVILFAFIAGVVTILSPCILPVLPIILSSGVGDAKSRARPFGIIVGFILSFTFFTLFLSSIVRSLNIEADLLRKVSIVLIGLFGISYLIPQVQIQLEKLFSKLGNFVPRGNINSGFSSGVVVGLSLGLLWTPCVGPILASVITLAITGTVTAQAILITLSYSVGTAIPMFFVMLAGQNAIRKLPGVTKNAANIQKAFGVVMVLTAIAMFLNWDRFFQYWVLRTFPNYGTGLTKIEEIYTKDNMVSNFDKLSSDLAPKKTAPELIQGGEWFNSNPQTVSSLKGKVVIIDFWTYSCINCQRTLPYLKDWHKKYSDKGLVIIGVHSPEFEFEKKSDNVQKAISDFGIEYPIMQDNEFATWKNYANRYWPAKYLIDKDGYIRYTHFGEGNYKETEEMIVKLLGETGEKIESEVSIVPNENRNYAKTHETYLGLDRATSLTSPEKPTLNKTTTFSAPIVIANNKYAFEGNWEVGKESVKASVGSKLYLNFDAKRVFLVMSPSGKPTKVKVTIDDVENYYGSNVDSNGLVTVSADTLYNLVDLEIPGRHILILEFVDGETEIFAFTFG